ncbi:PIR Superfamily Protein [Plasmodium ovale wallikeri]|uniref:PIR Superfamily Protein n=1 Tax=Plasmodium ovale wallikeri TaxID=864142 RepID=A0A1A9AS89_PLAOA|nr:PIR Superfamily Protein [Plasmodium ovale wallikeri]SBT59030.1 PIR Superfamily Protein [Plasmodium ovale wallikeri]
MTTGSCFPAVLKKENYYEKYFRIYKQFNNVNNIVNAKVFQSNNIFLRNVALYFSEFYNEIKVICSINDQCPGRCKEHCNYLNLWLDEKRDLYTSGGNCTYNKKLWDEYIEELWKELKQNSGETPFECERSKVVVNDQFPKEGIPNDCGSPVPVQFSLTCDNVPDHDLKEIQYIDRPISTASKIASSMGYFTPLGLWFNRLIKEKKRKWVNTDEEEIQEFMRTSENSDMPFENRGIGLNYHSSRNSHI